MSIPQSGDTIVIPAYTPASEKASNEISWSQNIVIKKATYYTVKATNKTQGGDVLLYIQDSFYKDEKSPDHVSKLGTKVGDNYEFVLNDKFQYGQKDKQGMNRFVVLHNKGNMPYQHRFLVTTIQGKAADWAKTLASTFGAAEVANSVHKLGSSFVGDYLHTF